MYERYAPEVFKFLMKLTKDHHLAEELTQETFFKAFMNIDKFEGRSKLSVWLLQISKNLYFDHLKTLKKIKDVRDRNSLEIREVGNMEDKIIRKNRADHILNMLHKLPEAYQEVFFDKIYLDLSYKEISHKYGRSETWVRVTYYRAKVMLQKKVRDNKL